MSFFNWLKTYLKKAESYTPFRSIIEMTLIDTAFMIMAGLIYGLIHFLIFFISLFFFDECLLLETARPLLKESSSPFRIFYIMTIGPLLETLLFQCIPIEFLNLITQNIFIVIGAPTLVFALAHAVDVSMIKYLFSSILFTWIYWSRRKQSQSNAFILTWATHSLVNFNVTIIRLFINYLNF